MPYAGPEGKQLSIQLERSGPRRVQILMAITRMVGRSSGARLCACRVWQRSRDVVSTQELPSLIRYRGEWQKEARRQNRPALAREFEIPHTDALLGSELVLDLIGGLPRWPDGVRPPAPAYRRTDVQLGDVGVDDVGQCGW